MTQVSRNRTFTGLTWDRKGQREVHIIQVHMKPTTLAAHIPVLSSDCSFRQWRDCESAHTNPKNIRQETFSSSRSYIPGVLLPYPVVVHKVTDQAREDECHQMNNPTNACRPVSHVFTTPCSTSPLLIEVNACGNIWCRELPLLFIGVDQWKGGREYRGAL